jgi:hypothetical protein
MFNVIDGRKGSLVPIVMSLVIKIGWLDSGTVS